MRTILVGAASVLLAACVHTPPKPSGACASFDGFAHGSTLAIGTVINGYGFTAVPGSLSFYDHARDSLGVQRIGLFTTHPPSGTVLNVQIPAGITEVRVRYVPGSKNLLPGSTGKQIRVLRYNEAPLSVSLPMVSDHKERHVTIPLGSAPRAQLVFQTGDEDTVTEICAVP